MHVEGLFRCGNKTYAIEGAVQTDDFEDSALCGVIRRNPRVLQCLREFKHLGSEFGRFVVGAVQNVELQLDARQPVPMFRLLPGKGVLIHVIAEPQVQEPVLLGDQKRRLPGQLLTLGMGVQLDVSGLGRQDRSEPLPHFGIFHFHPCEQGEHLAIELGLSHTDAWMARSGVAAAAVVDVVPLPCPALLGLVLAGDCTAAVAQVIASPA